VRCGNRIDAAVSLHPPELASIARNSPCRSDLDDLLSLFRASSIDRVTGGPVPHAICETRARTPWFLRSSTITHLSAYRSRIEMKPHAPDRRGRYVAWSGIDASSRVLSSSTLLTARTCLLDKTLDSAVLECQHDMGAGGWRGEEGRKKGRPDPYMRPRTLY